MRIGVWLASTLLAGGFATFDPAGSPIEPGGKFAYISDGPQKRIAGYTIGSNGALKQLRGSPFHAGITGASALAIDPQGQFMYVISGGSLAGLTIASDGSLKPVPGSPFPVGEDPLWVAIAPKP